MYIGVYIYTDLAGGGSLKSVQYYVNILLSRRTEYENEYEYRKSFITSVSDQRTHLFWFEMNINSMNT